ncbi:pancreatic lipase-related protein 2-like [Bacillus rossius redtenbacheri]|uniref:pancreatic lipase-related protein 2-like n=1 Tax=Bacillus rossius redtenbacheri TaxID=93214 RepID=UPI002FDDA6FB
MNVITNCMLFWVLLGAATPAPPRPLHQRPEEDHGHSDWVLLPDDDNGTLHWVDLSAKPEPFSVSEDDVTFLLYTRATGNNPTTLRIGDASSLGSFDARRRTELVIHGWNSNGNSMAVVTNAYLSSGLDLNVIVVDWRRPANLVYQSAVAATREVGAFVARLVDFLVGRGLQPADVNIVGFSLGAHVAGVAGQRCQSRPGRVTGLDPAGPMWPSVDRHDRLDQASGAHVQAIHTNGGGLGFGNNLGHADFYPNGGARQEGCGLDLIGSCSHGRANQFYAESVLGARFLSRECPSWQLFRDGVCAHNGAALMGHGISPASRGVYFLQTNGQSPFARG